MTTDELAAINERLAAALRCDDWGKHGLQLEFTPEKPGREASLWYGDGDQCATVHGNLGLGIDGDAVAQFFAKAPGDVKALLDDRDRMETENTALRKALRFFVLAFDLEKDKLDKKWSIGYWEGFDAGLVLANKGEADYLKDTRFRAVVRYTAEDIAAALKAYRDSAAAHVSSEK